MTICAADQFESDPHGVCPYELSNVATSCNLAGRPLAGASKWAGSLGGEYDQPYYLQGAHVAETQPSA